jgi:hypothetical protein
MRRSWKSEVALCAPRAILTAGVLAVRREHSTQGLKRKGVNMKVLILFVCWCILFVLCWPVAVLALILLPVAWLLSLPLRLLGTTVNALFALVRAVLFLPARLLGYVSRG